jgi:hypothetical protein
MRAPVAGSTHINAVYLTDFHRSGVNLKCSSAVLQIRITQFNPPQRAFAIHICHADITGKYSLFPMGDCMLTPERGRGVISMQNIVAALANKENLERWKNVVDLEKYGQPAAEFLIQALSDEDRWVRYLAADALANIGATNSIDSLISLLRDPEQDVRFAAAAALGKLGDPKAIKSLQEVLRKDNGYVKIAAEEALIRISPPTAGINLH